MTLRFKSLKDKYSLSDFIHRKKDYVFLDLEFNCFTNDDSFHEITSIGAIKCDKNFKNINCFHAYVTPIGYEKVTNQNSENSFYTLNTNKKAPKIGCSFKTAIENFCTWLGETETNIFVWGTQDTPVLASNLEAANIQNEYSFLLNRIKNIQPDVSGSIKVLGNPINYSISLENMKKLFFLKKEVAHNGLLDSIDLMTIFKKYKSNAPINQDILYELSYIYRNVDTDFQFCNLKKSVKNKNTNPDLKSRVFINKPSSSVLKDVLYTLHLCKFKFNNEYPKFSVNKKNNEIVFDKLESNNINTVFNTTKNPSVFEILDDSIKLNLNNGEVIEQLDIKNNDLNIDTLEKLQNEILLSSYIYKDLEIHEHNISDIDILNHFLQNSNIYFSNNIEDMKIIEDKIYIKRKKDDNGNLVPRFNCNFYIKDEHKHHILSIYHKSTNKNNECQVHFTIPKTKNSNRIVQELLSTNPESRFVKPKLTNITADTKKLIFSLAKNGALRTKRKSQIFAGDNKLSFLNGRNMECIDLDNASFFIANKERPFIILKNTKSSRTFEIKVLKNKNTIGLIHNLFKVYSIEKPKITKILDINNNTFDKLNALKNLPEFKKANKLTYSINNSYIKFRKNISNEFNMEIYDLSDFITTININKHFNVSINFTNKKDKKKIFATCINSKRLSDEDLNTFIKYVSKSNQDKKFCISYFSEELFNILSTCHKQGIINYSRQYTDLLIEEESFKFKSKKIHQNHIDLDELSIEFLESKHLMFIKLFDKENMYYYSIENNSKNEPFIKNLFKSLKKQKVNSWIKVLEINKYLRNSIWRVLENSHENNFSMVLNTNYIQVAQKKYFYKHTPLSIKKINSEEMVLQFGENDSTLCNISINEKNKMFIDDLINNSLFYEAN